MNTGTSSVKKALKPRSDGIIIIDDHGTIQSLNGIAQDLFRYDLADAEGHNIEMLIPGICVTGEFNQGSRPIEVMYETKAHRRDGTTLSVEAVLSELLYGDQHLFVLLVRDIEERVTKRAALEYQVVYDALTGLPNRILFYDRLHQSILSGKRLNNPFSIFIIDLDNFRKVNDAYGHYTGDWVLQQIASRLSGELRESDTVARLGGDEFAILLPTTESADQARRVAEKLLQVVSEPIELDGEFIQLGASFGVALYPSHGRDAQALIQHADLAMSNAQDVNSSKCDPAQPEQVRAATNLKLKSELHQALENNELVIHYQPKVEIKTGSMISVEALVRWQHPDLDLLTPDNFIHLAEQSGFIRPLGLWVARTALEQCAKWRAQGHLLNVAINLSTCNLQDEDLPDQLLDVINGCSARPEWLELEITESAVMTDPQHALHVLEQLSGFGMRISIDDFGTGYSSLTYLKRLPVDELKIDKSFILDMTEDNEDSMIVRATVDLAHNLGLKVVAEGVVSYKSWSLLSALGCDAAQGYYISRPLTAEQITRWLKETGPRIDWAHF